MLEILILGVIVIYGVSTIICMLVMLCGLNKDTDGIDLLKGLTNSFIPILNTKILIDNLFTNYYED